MAFVQGRSQYNWEHGIVCKNPHCKSYLVAAHPNCLCGQGGPQTGATGPSGPSKSITSNYAQGGEVHHCSTLQPHSESCPMFASGGEVEANQEFESNPSLSVDHAIAANGLLHTLQKTGHSRSEDPNKPTQDYIDSVRRGRKSVESHTKNHFDKKHEHPEANKDDIGALKKHLDYLRENPSAMLEIGGNIPGSHSGVLSAKAATTMNYLNSIRPKQFQAGPLDPPMAPSKMDSQYYDRQVGLAENPVSVLGHVKAGTIQPQDLQTLRALYPNLEQSLTNQVGSSLIDTKTKNEEISHKHKMGLSRLLSQPLDGSMTAQSMQAIIASAKTPEQGNGKGKKSSGQPTAATQKTLDKTDSLYQTPLESRQINKKA
jgi:hypothetical protein